MTIPTLKDIEDSKKAMDDIQSFTYDTVDNFIDSKGVLRDTVTGRIKKMGYAVPITYTVGIVFGANDNVKTVEESNVIYAPLPSSLPFTTSGTFVGDDDSRFFVVQGLDGLSFTEYFDTIADLISSSPVAGMLVKTKGRLTATDEKGALYLVSTTVPVDLFKNPSLGAGLYALWQSGISALTTRKEDVEFKAEDKYFGGQSEIFEGGGVLILGDSNSQGFGSAGAASDSYRTGFAFKLIQSIYNAVDQGQEEDRGFRYGSILSLVSELEDPGVSTDGTLTTSGGAVDSFITLAPGESISITGREVTFCDCYYTSASGTLSLEFYLNGVLFDTKVLTPGVGETAVFTTFPTQINTDGTYIKDTDVLKIQAAAGTDVSITGLLTLRTSNANYSPHVVIAAKSGWALNNFNPSLVADNISRHMNLIRGVGAKILVVVALGTNDIYNPTHADTPADYITQLSTLITNYTDKLTGNAEFLIEIPPESGSLFGTATGDQYLEYVSEIINFCETNGHQMIRLDKSAVSDSDTYLFDNGVHFDGVGATIVAKEMCRTIGVPYNPYVHKFIDDGTRTLAFVVEASSQAAEDAAFADGALAVIRLDLIAPDSSLFMDFETSLTKDDSRIDHTMTIVNTVTSVVSGAPVGAKAADVTAGFFTTPSHSSLDISGGQWGLELYHKLVDNTAHNMFMSKGSTSVLNDEWYFGLLSSGPTDLNVTFSGVNNNLMMSFPYPHELDLTNYHHLSLNADGVNLKLYIDGSLSVTVPLTTVYENGDIFYLGDWAFSLGNDGGLIDQVVVSNTGPLRTADFTPPTGP